MESTLGPAKGVEAQSDVTDIGSDQNSDSPEPPSKPEPPIFVRDFQQEVPQGTVTARPNPYAALAEVRWRLFQRKQSMPPGSLRIVQQLGWLTPEEQESLTEEDLDAAKSHRERTRLEYIPSVPVAKTLQRLSQDSALTLHQHDLAQEYEDSAQRVISRDGDSFQSDVTRQICAAKNRHHNQMRLLQWQETQALVLQGNQKVAKGGLKRATQVQNQTLPKDKTGSSPTEKTTTTALSSQMSFCLRRVPRLLGLDQPFKDKRQMCLLRPGESWLGKERERRTGKGRMGSEAQEPNELVSGKAVVFNHLQLATLISYELSSNLLGRAPQAVMIIMEPKPEQDLFYGQEETCSLVTRFLTHLFECPEYPPSNEYPQSALKPSVMLPYFIVYALHRAKLHTSIPFAALILLLRLKECFPTARGCSGHRLFISALMIASKVICEDSYTNKSWCIVAQGMFNLAEINKMEREMCRYLDWDLKVDNPILGNSEAMVKHDFVGDGPYPTYPVKLVTRRATKVAAPVSVPPRHAILSPIESKPVMLESKPVMPRPIQIHVPLYSSPANHTPSLCYSRSLPPASSSKSPATPKDNSHVSHSVKALLPSSPIPNSLDSSPIPFVKVFRVDMWGDAFCMRSKPEA
ncbi:hypothetical protein HGRIS_003375 [Hohenbuehelia grisea]|uniref:Cyclin-like domain-containing protein n=1 Tax=Hohenbuehelia grisea TaxID=104357 RepID=A0ABR3JF98_9AGAR